MSTAKLPIASTKVTARWLWQQLKQRWLLSLSALIAGLLSGQATVVVVTSFGRLVDCVNPKASSPGHGFGSLIATIVVATVLVGVFTALSNYLLSRLGLTIVAWAREQVVSVILALKYRDVERFGTGDVLSRATSDINAVTRGISDILPQVDQAIFLAVTGLCGMFSLNWRLGIIGILIIPGYYYALRWYLPQAGPKYMAQRTVTAQRSQLLVGGFHGLETIHAYEKEDMHLAGIRESSHEARVIVNDLFSCFTRFAGRVNRAEFVGLFLIMTLGFFYVQQHWVSIGELTAAALLFHSLFNPVGMLMYSFDEIQNSGAALKRLVGVISIQEPSQDYPGKPEDSSVEFSHVSFGYTPDNPVLTDVSFTVPAGSSLAIVGATGAGKSTIAALVSGLEHPDSGNVRLGGVNVSDIPPDQLRSHVALISQQVHVFAGTVADNVRLANPGATEEQILAAFTKIGAMSWIESLDNGIDTDLSTVDVSMMRSQQLALARILVLNPDVVVMDESSAEVGSAYARELDASSMNVIAGRTSILIAHRLALSKEVDAIAVVDHGVIIQYGTHDELCSQPGKYAMLWQAYQQR